jgi:GGDEF domain-containing protein
LPAPATADKAQQAKRGRAATGSAARAEPDRYAELLTRQPGSRDEARALREAWRALVEDGLDPARADEARVRVIRSGLAAYRLGGSPDDLLQLQSDAALYLARADARQRERVREWLRGLPSESDH